MVPRRGRFLTHIPSATALPAWLTEAGIDFLRRLDPFKSRDSPIAFSLDAGGGAHVATAAGQGPRFDAGATGIVDYPIPG
jgi:hypothetical protein